jgi:hypothetical protein
MRRAVVSLVALVLVTPALAKKPPRCPDGTWVIVGERLLPTDPGASPMDSVTISGRSISIESGCPPKNGTVKGTKHGTKVRGRWPKCGALKHVVLKALIDTGCAGMTGTVKAKGGATSSFNGLSGGTTTTTTTPADSTTTTTTAPGGSTTTTTLPLGTCGTADLAALKQVAATGGTLAVACSGAIYLDETLSVDGANVTVTGFVTIGRDVNAFPSVPPFRLIDVRSGSLTLDGPTLRNGQVIGGNGGDGTDGQQGSEGTVGGDGGPGANGTPGGPGGQSTEASAGGDGGTEGGAAMKIAAGATVVLRNCRVEQNVTVGGNGGEGGEGGRGGQGGPGGRGGSGEGTNGGAGATGGGGGPASPGLAGGAGGDAEGGAIHNEGTLTIEGCTFAGNNAAGGTGGRGGFGANGGGGGSGGNGGGSLSNAPTGTNGGNGGKGGGGGSGQPGREGGNGGDGGGGFGGAIYNTGTLTVSDTTFRNNFATGRNGGFGRSGGGGGGGGDGALGGIEGANDDPTKTGGMGGNGGNGKKGGDGGSNGNGGNAIGGAIFSTTQPTLTDVVFQQNACTAGSGGVNNCTAGDFTCFGAGGPGGELGLKGSGGSNWPLGDGHAADGADGESGDDGENGAPGQSGAAADANCHAGGGSCSQP